LVKDSRYVLTIHAVDEMEADGLTVYDVEHCILSGKIVARQRDRERGEWKYIVEGRALDRARLAVVAKIGPMGRVVIITVYLL